MRTWSKLLLLSAIVGASSACLIERPQVPRPECTVNSECPSGKICGGAGRCVDACSQDTDCQAPLTCTAGACAAPPGRCARDADCSDGKTCANTFCATPCTDASACASGESCFNGGCLLVTPPTGCRYDSECSAGQACVQGRCGDRCRADADCAAPLTCAQGACVPPSGRCAADGDCASTETCVATVCAARCTDAAGCGPNQACLNGACAALQAGTCRYTSECANGQACIQGRCAAACLATADCTAGTECRGGVCQVIANGCFASAQCDAGLACAPTGSCVPVCASDAACASTGETCSNGACVATGPGFAIIAGQATVTGVADAGVFPVTVKGPSRLTGTTRPDGTFSFAGLLPGLYDVSVSVPSTVEGTVVREVAALGGATATAGPFAFSPVGSVSGQVTLQGRTSFEGIGLSALGTSRGTVTDTAGNFTLTGLAPGTYDLLATAPGYQAGQFQGVVVTWQAVTTATPALQLAPVPAGSTFAFSSLPPTSVRQYRPFVYTAVAGGGGVGAVTYVLEAGPAGMTLNGNTGQVTWTPTRIDRPWVAISARGGSQVIYQYFEVDVLAPFDTVSDDFKSDLEVNDAGVWAGLSETVLQLLPDGGRRVYGAPPAQSGTVTGVELLNGGAITGFRAHAGTLSTVQVAAGVATVTWEGGTVGSVTSDGGFPVTALRFPGGQIASVAFPGATRVSSFSYPTGTPSALTPVTWPLTTVRARTGLVDTVAGNTLTDPAANWGTGELTTALCVTDASISFRSQITSHTATSITVNPATPTSIGSLDTKLAPGQRYFVITCSNPANNLQYVVESSGASFGSLTSPAHAVALYARASHLATYAVTANTATGVTFLAPLSRWAEFSALPAGAGFFAVGPGNTSTATAEVRLADPAANFAADLASSSRVGFDALTTTYAIASNTATELVFRIPIAEVLTLPLGGRRWILTNSSSQVPVTLTTTSTSLPPGITDRLWVDTVGQFFSVSDNTSSTVTALAPIASAPFTSWANSELAWGPAGAVMPTTVVTDAAGGLVPGAHVGRMLQRLIGTSDLHRERPIAANDATTVTLSTGGNCAWLTGANCLLAMEKLRASLTGSRWFTGADINPQLGDLVLSLGGSPALSPNALVGTTALLSSGAAFDVIANTANTITVSVPESVVTPTLALAPPLSVFVSRTGTGEPLTLDVRVTGATWAANQWLGYRVVASNGNVAGRVFSNTADTLEVESLTANATERAAATLLVPGEPFGLAGPHPEGLDCSGSYSVRARANLAGATLSGATGLLRFGNGQGVAFTASRVDAAGGDLVACPDTFDTLLAGRGQQALLTPDGLAAFSFTDASANHTPGALAGLRLRLSIPTAVTSMGGLTITNTAQRVSVSGAPVSTFFSSLLPTLLAPGTSYSLADDASRVWAELTTTATLTPSAFKGRGVRLVRASDGSVVTAGVVDNDTQRLTVRLTDTEALQLLPSAGANQLRYVLTSSGEVVRVTIGGATLTPGALVGENITVGGDDGRVLENTATTITVAEGSPNSTGARFTARTMQATTWSTFVPSVAWDGIAATAAGGAIASTWAYFGESGLFEVAPDGSTSLKNPLKDGRAFRVEPIAGASGVVAQAPVTTNGLSTFSDPTWSFTPGSLVGQFLALPECGSTQEAIIANTATSLTVRDSVSCAVGSPWWIHTFRVRVVGATLQPGELADRLVLVNGLTYRVRENTATEIALLPRSTATSREGTFSGEPVPAAGGWLFDFEAFPFDNTEVVVSLPTGYAVAGWSSLARRDGSQFRVHDERTTATTLHTVTVEEVLSGDRLRVSPGGFTSGALVGKSLQANGVAFAISGNTADTISLPSTSAHLFPLPGRTYRVTENDGLTGIQSLAADGAVLWVGTNRGLFRHDGTTWSRYTRANTESAPGLGDGLPSDDVREVEVLAPGEVWVGGNVTAGAARLVGGTWTRFTVASTESAPGRADGLGDNWVLGFSRDASGATWFAHNGGVSRLQGTTWQQNFGLAGTSSSVLRVVIAPWGTPYFASSRWLYRVDP